MIDQPEYTDRDRRCISIAFAAGITASIVGLAVLSGWAFDIELLKTVLPGYATMKPLTAICFTLCGFALASSCNRQNRLRATAVAVVLSILCSSTAALISLTTLLEYLLNRNVIDGLLFRKALLSTKIPDPGRMAPATAFELLLISVAIVFLRTDRPRAIRISIWLALLATPQGMIAVLGYLYNAQALYRFNVYASTALHTAILIVMLGIGIPLSRPRDPLISALTSDLSGGWLARRLLPIAVIAPISIGYIRLAGQRAGLYDTEFGLALFVAATIIIFSVVVWLSARSLNRLDTVPRFADLEMARSTAQLQKTADSLRESEERFRAFMGHLPAAAFLKDREGRYVWGNLAWRNQFTASECELLGKTDDELWSSDVAAVFAASDTKVFETGLPIQLVETTGTGSNLRQRLVSKFRVPGPGEASLIGGIAFDTTENKRLEIQLFRSQKLEAIGLLAGGVAHDFNNLLTVILGYSDMNKAMVGDNRALADSFDAIRDAALRAADLTRQLLAFGRKQVMRPRVISINEELTETKRLLGRVIREDIRLNLLLASSIGLVKADPVQIQQVILNLAMNAQDAMSAAGSLTIETANVELDETVVHNYREIQPGHYVMLAVSDTGTGMDPETLAHAFEPFFTTKANGKGTGLGLATVYGIIKQSGGYIYVYSEPDRGTSFKIYLPRVDDGETSRTGDMLSSSTAPVEKVTATILIVEDDDRVRLLLVTACRNAGYAVLDARQADEALALIETYPATIHLLISDVIMPGMSGQTLADQIVRRRPATRILFCSGYTENAMIHHDVLSTGVEFLQKPFTVNILLNRVRSLLSSTERPDMADDTHLGLSE